MYKLSFVISLINYVKLKNSLSERKKIILTLWRLNRMETIINNVTANPDYIP